MIMQVLICFAKANFIKHINQSMIMLLKFKITKPNYPISLTNPLHDSPTLVVIETNNMDMIPSSFVYINSQCSRCIVKQ